MRDLSRYKFYISGFTLIIISFFLYFFSNQDLSKISLNNSIYESGIPFKKKENNIKNIGFLDFTLVFNKPIIKQFEEIGFSSSDIRQIFNDININYDLRKLKAGQLFKIEYESSFIYEKDDSIKIDLDLDIYKKIEKKFIKNLYFKSESGIKIKVHFDKKEEKYKTQLINPQYHHKIQVERINITTNLFTDASLVNINPTVIYKVLNQYAFSVDFQRDIRKNDNLIIVLDSKIDEDGDVIFQKLIYSNLILSKINNEIFLFEDQFYDRKGNSVVKSLLMTPIDGARISSGFSFKRKHPVLGYSRAHKGTDFAAVTGTPIQCAGDGTVIFVGWKGAFGKFISIRHNSEYTTNYGHLSKFNSRTKVGHKVKQRDIIGYVGSTGLATGPHLHYELVERGRHINPRNFNKIKNTVKKVTKDKIDLFHENINTIDKILRNSNLENNANT